MNIQNTAEVKSKSVVKPPAAGFANIERQALYHLVTCWLPNGFELSRAA
jgi:hypothetical protein